MRAAKMAFGVLLALMCTLRMVPAADENTDEQKPYGRLCFSVIDASGSEAPFVPAANSAAGGTIIAHTDANAPCAVLVVAFNEKDGSLTNGWRPQFTQMGQWEEQQLPASPAQWQWTKTDTPFAFWVLFFAPDSTAAAGMQKLVDAMRNPSLGAHILELQTSKLHELIGRAIAGQDKHLASFAPTEIGGVMRGGEFQWRQYARSANFSAEAPGVLIFSSAASK